MINTVKTAVQTWKILANKMGIPRIEQSVMASAFRNAE